MPSEEGLATLMSMGFSRDQSCKALKSTVSTFVGIRLRTGLVPVMVKWEKFLNSIFKLNTWKNLRHYSFSVSLGEKNLGNPICFRFIIDLSAISIADSTFSIPVVTF